MTDAIPLRPAGAGRPPSRARRTGGWAAAVAVLVIIAAVVWVGSVAFRVWWVARDDEHPRSDAIVVLGASQYDGVPSPILQARLEHALTLYGQGVAPRIITVGGKLEGDRFTEAEAGKKWLVGAGVPQSDVIAVPTGSDTWASTEAVASVMKRKGLTSAVIVTDPWHSLRAREMARHAGVTATTSPTRSGPIVRERLTELRYVARETGAYVDFQWRRLTGGLATGE